MFNQVGNVRFSIITLMSITLIFIYIIKITEWENIVLLVLLNVENNLEE